MCKLTCPVQAVSAHLQTPDQLLVSWIFIQTIYFLLLPGSRTKFLRLAVYKKTWPPTLRKMVLCGNHGMSTHLTAEAVRETRPNGGAGRWGGRLWQGWDLLGKKGWCGGLGKGGYGLVWLQAESILESYQRGLECQGGGLAEWVENGELAVSSLGPSKNLVSCLPLEPIHILRNLSLIGESTKFSEAKGIILTRSNVVSKNLPGSRAWKQAVGGIFHCGQCKRSSK